MQDRGVIEPGAHPLGGLQLRPFARQPPHASGDGSGQSRQEQQGAAGADVALHLEDDPPADGAHEGHAIVGFGGDRHRAHHTPGEPYLGTRLADDRIWTAFPAAARLELFDPIARNRQDITLLGLVAPDLQRRHAYGICCEARQECRRWT